MMFYPFISFKNTWDWRTVEASINNYSKIITQLNCNMTFIDAPTTSLRLTL